ncbi:MAG TPA: hypothetical protein VNL98_05555 [Gemmatimonadales bacterium]|nr:hypothetical protein [Gemmatimonadales bacterium]
MGCLRSLFTQIGCLVFFIVAGALAFVYREQVTEAYRRLRGLPVRVEVVYVAPLAGDAESAAAKLEQLRRRGGPAFVDLTAAEVAGLIAAALDSAGVRGFDSVRVALGNGELLVRGSLETRGIPREVLGPLRGAIDPRESLSFGGPLASDSAGRLTWTLTALSVRDFPFPRATIPALLRALRIRGANGAVVPVPAPAGVGDVRVSPRMVRAYRSSPR